MPKSIPDKPFFCDGASAYAKLESIIWPTGPICVHCGETVRRRLAENEMKPWQRDMWCVP